MRTAQMKTREQHGLEKSNVQVSERRYNQEIRPRQDKKGPLSLLNVNDEKKNT